MPKKESLKSGLYTTKLELFPLFILGKIGQENELHDMVEGKNAFFDYKKEKLKKSKNWDCFKGVSPWFWSKIGTFSIFLFEAK